MSITSYAQNFEDVMLWRALGHIEHGFYIDIGAQDPIIDSVSLAFHENGWHGIHVEPTPHYAQLLRQQRPGDTVIQAAVGNGPALMKFFEIPHTGISTADAEIATQHRERGFDVKEIVVTSIALSAIFSTCPGEIHWLKVDVEGFEQQLLSSWGDSPARPWIVVVESTLPLTQIESHNVWESIITGYGYSPVYFDGLNRYYVSHLHPELEAAFSTPPNVFDGFALNGTASAPFHRIIKERFETKISEAVTECEQQKASFDEAKHTLASENSQTKQALETLQHAHTQLLSTQHQVEREKTELMRNQSEQERVLHAQLSWLQQERVTREQALHEQTIQAKVETENILLANAQREQDFAKQLLLLQEQAELDKLMLVQSYGEQERVIRGKFDEQEQGFQQKLLALHEQLSWLQQERVSREQTLHEQTNQARQEIEKILQAQTRRELDFATQLLDHQQQVAEGAAAQTRDYREQERTLSLEYAVREDALKQKLQATQTQVHLLLEERARREQEIGEQLLAIQQQAWLEMRELTLKHSEQFSELHRLNAEREQHLGDQLQAGRHEFQSREQDWKLRDREHADQIGQSRQALEALQRNFIQREREASAQLLTIQQQAELEKAEYTDMLEACAAMEAQLQAEMRSAQQAYADLSSSLEEAQNSLESTHASLSWRMTAPLRKLGYIFGLPRQQSPGAARSNGLPKTKSGTRSAQEIQSATQFSNDSITPGQSAEIPADMPSVPVSASASDLTTPEQIEPMAQPAPHISGKSDPFRSNISKFAHTTAEKMSKNATTLSELLALHDQQFVRGAYKTLLGRSPDPEGFEYYLDRVRTGFSKIQIVTQLCLSNEGKAYSSDLPGLNAAIARYQKQNKSFLGIILKAFNAGEGNGPAERKIRAIENQIFLFEEKNQERFDQIDSAISSLYDFIASRPFSASGQSSTSEDSAAFAAGTPAPAPAQVKNSVELNKLSPRAREFYSKIKSVPSNNTQRRL